MYLTKFPQIVTPTQTLNLTVDFLTVSENYLDHFQKANFLGSIDTPLCLADYIESYLELTEDLIILSLLK